MMQKTELCYTSVFAQGDMLQSDEELIKESQKPIGIGEYKYSFYFLNKYVRRNCYEIKVL